MFKNQLRLGRSSLKQACDVDDAQDRHFQELAESVSRGEGSCETGTWVAHGDALLGREPAGDLVHQQPVTASMPVQRCCWVRPLKGAVLPGRFWCVALQEASARGNAPWRGELQCLGWWLYLFLRVLGSTKVHS